MVSELPRSRWASLALMGLLAALPSAARAQSAFGLLSAGPEWGEPGERRGSDGTALDVEQYGPFHRYPTEGFTVAGAEVGASEAATPWRA
jgi:hypothetical protein